MTSIKLTIAIPTFNRAPMLKQSVDHLIANLSENVEILIFDNCSTDNTPDVCASFTKRLNLNIFRNNQNVGAARNIFLCFLHAKGKYISILGDDDKLDGTYVKAVLEEIEKNEFGFITYQEELTQKPQVEIIKAGGDAVANVFMRSGTLAGNVFNRNYVNLITHPPLDHSIYPQIATAIQCALREKIGVIHISKVVDVDFYNNLNIVDKGRDRPGDFGIGERLSHILALRERGEIGRDVYSSCVISLMTWARSTWVFKNDHNPKYAKIFVKELLRNSTLLKTKGFYLFLKKLPVSSFEKVGWFVLYVINLLRVIILDFIQWILHA